MANFLAQSNYTITQLHLPLDLQVTFRNDDQIMTFYNLVKDIDFNKFFIKTFKVETRGRKRKERANILKVILFAYSIKVRSTRVIKELCKTDTRFMFLLDGVEAPSHVTINETINSLVFNIDDILVEINKKIMEHDLDINPNIVYIDGTKIEAYANKYTFVWKKAVLTFKDRLIKKIKNLLPELNEVFKTNDYPIIPDKEIYTPEELLEIILILNTIIDKVGIALVYGKGSRKDNIQRLFDAFEEYHNKMVEYDNHLKIIGENRNSYSKTDRDATFMRMKEDYMKNGQLKPGYNVQIGVANEYIMAIELYQNRSDYETFIPFVEHYKDLYGFYPEKPTADAGYGGYDNYKFCYEHGIGLYQKYSTYTKEKEKKYKNNPFNKINFKKDEDGNYICPNNKKLIHIYNKKIRSTIYEAYEKVYKCSECDGCPLRDNCTTSKEGRSIKVNEELEKYKQVVRANLESPEGIRLRINRSIQVEGTFGVMKEDMNFKRFSRRSILNARLEITLLAIGMNISKFHNRKYRIVQ